MKPLIVLLTACNNGVSWLHADAEVNKSRIFRPARSRVYLKRILHLHMAAYVGSDEEEDGGMR